METLNPRGGHWLLGGLIRLEINKNSKNKYKNNNKLNLWNLDSENM
jgi:hypothetical protein